MLSIDVGARRPLGASVSGIALLAGLPPAEARALTQRNAQRLQGAGRTVAQVLAAAEACRAHGHTYAPEGVMPGTSALAVPLRDAAGGVVGAVSIAALADRLTRERVRGAVARMQEQVALVSQRLGEIERARNRRR